MDVCGCCETRFFFLRKKDPRYGLGIALCVLTPFQVSLHNCMCTKVHPSLVVQYNNGVNNWLAVHDTASNCYHLIGFCGFLLKYLLPKVNCCESQPYTSLHICQVWFLIRANMCYTHMNPRALATLSPINLLSVSCIGNLACRLYCAPGGTVEAHGGPLTQAIG